MLRSLQLSVCVGSHIDDHEWSRKKVVGIFAMLDTREIGQCFFGHTLVLFHLSQNRSVW